MVAFFDLAQSAWNASFQISLHKMLQVFDNAYKFQTEAPSIFRPMIHPEPLPPQELYNEPGADPVEILLGKQQRRRDEFIHLMRIELRWYLAHFDKIKVQAELDDADRKRRLEAGEWEALLDDSDLAEIESDEFRWRADWRGRGRAFMKEDDLKSNAE